MAIVQYGLILWPVGDLHIIFGFNKYDDAIASLHAVRETLCGRIYRLSWDLRDLSSHWENWSRSVDPLSVIPEEDKWKLLQSLEYRVENIATHFQVNQRPP